MKLVFEDGARRRLLWRLAKTSELLVDALNDSADESKKAIVSSVWSCIRRVLYREAARQSLDDFEMTPAAMSWLEMPISGWLEGGPGDSLIVYEKEDKEYCEEETGQWKVTPYVMRLLDKSKFRRLFLGVNGRVIQGRCAAFASCGMQERIGVRLWRDLNEAWRRRQIEPPAASITELLTIPVSWWLAGGVEANLIYEGRSGFRPTAATWELAPESMVWRSNGSDGSPRLLILES